MEILQGRFERKVDWPLTGLAFNRGSTVSIWHAWLSGTPVRMQTACWPLAMAERTQARKWPLGLQFAPMQLCWAAALQYMQLGVLTPSHPVWLYQGKQYTSWAGGPKLHHTWQPPFMKPLQHLLPKPSFVWILLFLDARDCKHAGKTFPERGK